jgi:hypothetical protein
VATTKDRLLQAYRKGDMTALRNMAQQMRAIEHRANRLRVVTPVALPEPPKPAPEPVVKREELVRVIEKTMAPDEQILELQRQKELAEIELRRVQAVAVQNEQAVALYWATVLEGDAKNRAAMAQVVQGLGDAVAGMQDTMRQFQSTIDSLIAANAESAKRAAEALARPKRVIRENGRIVGIEIGSKS